MKKIFYLLLTVSKVLFSLYSCGDTNDVKPIKVDVEEWEDVLLTHTDKANAAFESLIDMQELEISSSESESKADETISIANDLISETSAHQITGTNAKKLETEANKTKEAAINLYNNRL